MAVALRRIFPVWRILRCSFSDIPSHNPTNKRPPKVHKYIYGSNETLKIPKEMTGPIRPVDQPAVADELKQPERDDLFLYIDVETKSHDTEVLKSYETFALTAAKHLGIEVSKTDVPQRIMWRRTLLKSVHIYKDHRVQYETRTNLRLMQLRHVTGSTASTYLEYLQRFLPEGVGMKVTKHKLEIMPDFIIDTQNQR